MTEQTISIILAGGAGQRLHPLTADRAKPAVPFGGRYRIIDFTLSNCLHSGLRRILVLTQYKSQSLQRHLRDGWSIYNAELGDYITSVPPQMRTGDSWYSGTADALYQNLYLLERSRAEYVLILSGDHIYRMDYAAMLQHHHDAGADLTIACLTVDLHQARSFGVMTVDDRDRIVSFHEKPQHPPSIPGDPEHALASMGVYVFSLDRLAALLREDHEGQSSHDFGSDIIPAMVGSDRVVAYRFGGTRGRVTADHYWRDVGTLDAFYEANMDLLRPVPAMDLYQDDWSIRTHEGQHPPARSVPGRSGREAEIVNCMLAGGTLIIGGAVHHSILFPSVRVEEGASVESSLLFQGVRLGEGAALKRCIVDKHVVIPPGERIGFDAARDAERFTVSDRGVVVVGKGYQFPT
ncbi:MAG TPA: glucose-1-phosphate adenylyltransferase [Vicinamibacterales bacterium]|nr:glucose-1-phosphate adenylyltransferase [Vicinamibacterales bacterium]